MDFVYLLNEIAEMSDICGDLAPALKIVGVFYKGIQIVVPILLIFAGMLDFAKAVTEKDEGKIKDAQQKLIKRAIAAVCVFLVTVIVGVLMNVVSNDDYKDCLVCVTGPFGEKCKTVIGSNTLE